MQTERERVEYYLETVAIRAVASWRDRKYAIDQGMHETMGMSEKDFLDLMGAPVKLPPVERAQAALELQAEGYDLRTSGAILGVSKDTISRAVSNATEKPEKPKKAVSNATNPDTDKLTQEIADLKKQLAEATKPAVTGQDKVQAELQSKIAQLEATVSKQNQQLMELSSESADLEDTLKKVATSKDEHEQQQIALAALNKIGQAVTSRAAARIDASRLAWDIRSLNQKLDTLIQGKGDDISDNDAAAIIRDFNELAQTIQVLKSRVEINKL